MFRETINDLYIQPILDETRDLLGYQPSPPPFITGV